MAASMRVVRFDFMIDPVFAERLAQDPGIELFVPHVNGPEEAAWAALGRAHVYMVNAAKHEVPRPYHVDDAFLARCPELLMVSSAGAGYDTADVEACTRAGVALVNQAGGNAVSVAEMAFGLILAVRRRIVEADHKIRTVYKFPRESLMGDEIAGSTLGIVGIGHIGTRVAALGKAFGLRVLAVDPFVAPDEIRRRGAEPVDLDTLCALSDIVTIHCPRDASTLHLFDAARLAKMKQDAILINTARGGIHDELALHAAIESGHLAGAGLDVWEPEPPVLDHPLLRLNTVVATCHTAGVTGAARRNIAAINADQIARMFRGERPPRLINPAVWPRFCERYEQAFGLPFAQA